MEFEGRSEDQIREEELRLKEREVKLSNQGIVELAYVTKDIIEACRGHHLYFEDANCYLHCFHLCRELLKHVDLEYLQSHQRLACFYGEGRELSNDWDILRWEADKHLMECLDIPLRVCPKTKDVCKFHIEGYCFESGERRDLSRAECE